MKSKIIIILSLLISSSLYSSGFSVPEQGAKSISMANASTAYVDDATAIFYNPAALNQLEGLNVNLGLVFLKPTNSWTDGDKTATTKDSLFELPQFNLTYRSKKDFSLGIGVNAPFAAGIEWPDAWEGAELIEMMNLQSINISPTIAYNINENLTLGISYDFGIAAVELRKRVKLSNEDWIIANMSSYGISVGHGFKIALLYNQPNKFKAGLVFKYGQDYHFKGKADFDVTNDAFLSKKPSDQFMTVDLSLPIEMKWGVVYYFNSKFLLSLDIQYTLWSSYDELKFVFEKNEFENEDGEYGNTSISKKNWNNVLSPRLGLEYKIDKLSLRGGYGYDLSPIPDETLDPSLPGSNRHIFALGFGYKLSFVDIDFAYSYVLFEKRDASKSEFKGEYEGNVNIFSFTTNFNF